MARRTARDRRLADAYNELRKLRNQLHDKSQATLPLRAEIQQLKNDMAILECKLARSQRVARSSKDALMSMMEAICAFAAEGEPIDTGKNG